MAIAHLSFVLLLSITHAQDVIPGLSKSQICAAAPCHDIYIENGVSIVNQTRISGPNGDGTGTICCGYDSFRQSLDPPRCCYNAALDLIDAESRFSCPLRGVQQPATCDEVVVTIPIPSNDKIECQARNRHVKKLCDNMSGLGTFYSRIALCPTGGFDVGALLLEKAVNFIRKEKFAIKEKSKTELEKFKDTFFTVVGVTLGVTLLTFEAPAGVVAAAVVGAYQAFCNIGTGLQVFGSICSAVEARYVFDNDCSKLPRSLVQILPVPSTLLIRQDDNICTQLLATLPTVADCEISATIECSTDTNNYLSAGLNASEASAFAAQCTTFQSSLQALTKLCTIRSAVAAIEPLCSPGEYISPADRDTTTTTPPTSSPPPSNITYVNPDFNSTFMLPTLTSTSVPPLTDGNEQPIKPTITKTADNLPISVGTSLPDGNGAPVKPTITKSADVIPTAIGEGENGGGSSNGGSQGGSGSGGNGAGSNGSGSGGAGGGAASDGTSQDEPTKTSLGDAVNSMIQFTGAGSSVRAEFMRALWKGEVFGPGSLVVFGVLLWMFL